MFQSEHLELFTLSSSSGCGRVTAAAVSCTNQILQPVLLSANLTRVSCERPHVFWLDQAVAGWVHGIQ